MCALCGALTALFVGFVKEVVDFFRDKPFDAKDWAFTAVGGLIGALMYLM